MVATKPAVPAHLDDLVITDEQMSKIVADDFLTKRLLRESLGDHLARETSEVKAARDARVAQLLTDGAQVEHTIRRVLGDRVRNSARRLVESSCNAVTSTSYADGERFVTDIGDVAALESWISTHVPYESFYDYLMSEVATLLARRNTTEQAGGRLDEDHEIVVDRWVENGYNLVSFQVAPVESAV